MGGVVGLPAITVRDGNVVDDGQAASVLAARAAGRPVAFFGGRLSVGHLHMGLPAVRIPTQIQGEWRRGVLNGVGDEFGDGRQNQVPGFRGDVPPGQ